MLGRTSGACIARLMCIMLISIERAGLKCAVRQERNIALSHTKEIPIRRNVRKQAGPRDTTGISIIRVMGIPARRMNFSDLLFVGQFLVKLTEKPLAPLR